MITLPVLLLALLFGVHSLREEDCDASFGSSDSSSSSGSSEHHHHHHHHRPRPPRPTRTPVVTTPAGPLCPSGWLTFDRPQGRWCVKLFTSTPNNYNWYTSQEACERMGATVSGVQTDDERLRLAQEGRRIIQLNGQTDTSIWLGARRRPQCVRNESCDKMNTFYWYDANTIGSAGIKWAITEPDGQVAGNGAAQDCIQQFIYPFANTSATWPNINHGEMDDQWCSWRDGPAQKLYVCGKRAVEA